MKIAQVVSTYPPYRGGMGNVAKEYTERLRARGHNVHVYTPRYKKRVTEDPRYVHRIPSPLHYGNAGVVPSLYKRLAGFDIIHLHYPFFGGAEPTVVRKAIRDDQALIMTYHMDAVAGGLKGAVFQAHRRVLFPYIVSRADRILVSSKDYAQSSALADIEGALDKVEIHPFGIDLERFAPEGEKTIREKHGIKEETPLLLFVGGLDPAHHFKGMSILLGALETVKGSDWQAIIIGDGSMKAKFQKEASERGLKGRLHFVGNRSGEELPEYFRAADIHLFPSTERAEAFGLVALEAAASGTPSIASNLPGVRTVVLDGETGLLVEPNKAPALADALLTLLENAELRERFGKSARKRTEVEFAWEPLITQLEETYRLYAKSSVS